MSAEHGYHGSRPLLVDTNVISYVLKHSELGAEYGRLLSGANVFLSVITLEELYFGAAKDAWDAHRRERLRQLIAKSQVLAADESIALVAAEVRANRSSTGRPLSQPDAWIAATALCYELPLVSHDRDFEGIQYLRLLSLHQRAARATACRSGPFTVFATRSERQRRHRAARRDQPCQAREPVTPHPPPPPPDAPGH